MEFIAQYLGYLVVAFNLAIFARVIMSWVAPNPSHPLSMFIIQITEPILAPIRRGINKIVPSMGALDLSPMVALILLNFVIMPIIRKLG